jgi:T5SS/PEP-CTERM-associated repeat protein
MKRFQPQSRAIQARTQSLHTLAGALLLLAAFCSQSTYAAVTFQGNVTPSPPGAGGSVAAPFIIGDVGSGISTINGGTSLSVTGGGSIVGDDATGFGVFTVTGFGSTFNVGAAAADFTVGNSGTGNVLIENFATVAINDDLFIAAGNNSSGFLSIEGLGTLVDANDQLQVGQGGVGTVELLDGARLFVDDSVIGQLITGEGRLTIAGLQTLLRQTNSMTIGDAGRGTFEIFDQAHAETTNVVLGNTVDGVALADVAGSGSVWEVTGFMHLGVNGMSELYVRDGARVANTSTARLATQGSAESYVEVSGPQSRWEIGTALTVGEFGFGTLNILAGGRVVTGDNATIGDNTNSRGEVVVDGPGSTWEIDGILDVSQPGEGKLTISNGGFVTATGVVRVAAAGELHMDGGRLASDAGSGLTNNGLVRGGGTIDAAVTNTGSGEVRIAPGDALVMQGALSNAGIVDVQSGELEVFGAASNSGGDIDVRNGVLRFQSGVTNTTGGQLAIVGGDVDIFGNVTNNVGAQVVVGGEAQAVMHDTFTNNGDLFIAPGADLLTLENLTFGAGGSMSVQISDSNPIDGFGQVVVGTTATVDGTLNVELVDSFVPSLGDSFQILSAGTQRTGFFAAENLPALGGGLVWDVNYNPDSIVLNVVNPVGNTGDYNDDGVVDAADYVVWRKFNNTSTTLPNDPSAGSVNDGDYNNWRENFGHAGGAGGANAVPEPDVPIACVFALFAFVTSRRLKSSPL